MQFKLIVLAVCAVVAMMSYMVEADFQSIVDCGDVEKSKCKSCCLDGVYKGYKWKKFGGSKNKVCVCVGESGTKDRVHRDEIAEEYTPYRLPPHLVSTDFITNHYY